jgi:cytochrome c oxidase subunit 3
MAITINSSNTNYKIHPKMFALYLSMGSMVMLFTALASALIVKKGDFKHWEPVVLPSLFLVSTLLIIVSSVFIQLANNALSKDKFSTFKINAIITSLLSVVFVVFQYLGWEQLMDSNIMLNGNPSGSYIYVISGFHGFHYIIGIFILLLILALTYSKSAYKNTSNAKLHFSMLTQYWHFIGLVWVFIYLFFKFVIYK